MTVNEAMEALNLEDSISPEVKIMAMEWIKWLGKRVHLDGVENNKGEVLIGFTIGHNMLLITIGESGVLDFIDREGNEVYDRHDRNYIMETVKKLIPVISDSVKKKVKSAYSKMRNLNNSLRIKLEAGSYTCSGRVEEVKELVSVVPVDGDYQILVDVKMITSGVPILGRCGILLSEFENKKGKSE